MKADAKLEDRMRTELMLREVLNAPTMSRESKEALVKEILQQKLLAVNTAKLIPPTRTLSQEIHKLATTWINTEILTNHEHDESQMKAKENLPKQLQDKHAISEEKENHKYANHTIHKTSAGSRNVYQNSNNKEDKIDLQNLTETVQETLDGNKKKMSIVNSKSLKFESPNKMNNKIIKTNSDERLIENKE